MLLCGTRCPDTTMIYLSVACDSGMRTGDGGAAAGRSSIVADLVASDFSTFPRMVDLNGSVLIPGNHYRLCADLDGVNSTLAMGPTFAEVRRSGPAVDSRKARGDPIPRFFAVVAPNTDFRRP